MSEIGVRPKLRCWAKMSMKQTQKSDFNEFRFWAHEPWEMVKNQFRLLNRSILMSELGVRPKLRFWAQTSSKQTQKYDSKVFNFWSHEPLRNGKKHARLWNRSILMSEIGVWSKLRCWSKMSMKQTRKIGLQRIRVLSSRTPLKW